jgi:autotransporter translocation and assembly factor TamB
VRRALQVIAILCTLVVGAASLALIVSQTAWFKDWLRGFIVQQADEYVNGRLTIGRLGGNLFFGVELEDIDVTMQGEPVVSIKDVGIDYNVLDFLGGGVVLDSIRLNKPVIHLRKEGETWNLGQLLKKQRKEAEREGPAKPIAIGEIGVTDGAFIVDGAVGTTGVAAPSRIDRLNAKIGFEYDPVNYTIRIGHLSFLSPDRSFRLTDLSGTISTKNDGLFFDHVAVRTSESSVAIDGAVQSYLRTPSLDLRVTSDKLALPEIARLVPALRGYALQPAFEVTAKGPLNALRLEFNTRSSAGQVVGNVVTDLTVPDQRIDGVLDLRHFDLAPLLRSPRPQHSDITGRAVVDVRLTGRTQPNPLAAVDGRWQLVAPRVVAFGYEARDVDARGRLDRGVLHVDGKAAAYGGRATVNGTIVPSTPLRLDLAGEAAHVDLRNLPPMLRIPKVASDLSVAYRLTGTTDHLSADATFHPSLFAGASIAEGGTAGVTIDGKSLGYRADASVRSLDLQRIGRAFGIDALSTERYASAVNGTFSVTGTGTTIAEMTLDARGTLVESRLFGGTVPRMAFATHLAGQALSVKAQGDFAGLNPAVLADRADLAGNLAGSIDVDTTLPNLAAAFDVSAVRVSGSVSLTDSRLRDLVITRANADGQYADGVADIKTLSVRGPAIELEASGRADIRQEGQSDLQYKASVTDLATVGRMVDTDVSGSIAAEGHLTGNAVSLETTGRASVSNLKYGGTSVLAAQTNYDVSVPELQPARAQVTADTTANLLEVAGRPITEATAHTTWKEQTLGFDAKILDQEKRTLVARGDVVLHPDHQEVHLEDFAARAEGVEWRSEPGNAAAIQYGNDRIGIQRLRLVNGTQRLAVDGDFGRPGDSLRIQADAVDVASLNTLALGTQKVGGTLNLTATVTGTREAPRADAEFSIANGSFREFVYQSLEGKVQYGADGARLETKLTQSPGAWIAAKGFIPPSAFRAPTAEERAAIEHDVHEVAPPDEQLDVAVTSSPLSLALVEGLVPQISKVSGTLQADVRVGGTPRDPHLNGAVDIKNGAFTVADLTKDGYTGLDTRIVFEPERVRLQEFRLLDEHQHTLSVSGELAVHQREVGGVQIAVKSDQFEIVDNELADVKLNTELRITGELRRPRVEGTLGAHTATINVDKVLALATSDAYAVEPTKLEAETPGAVPPVPNATPASAATQPPAPDAPPHPRAAESAPTGDAAVRAAGGTGAGATQAEARTAPAASPSVFDALTLDVRVTMPNNVVVKGTDLNPSGASPIGLGDINVTIGGDVRATKKPGEEVRLLGTVNTVRGTYDFQGRRFDIQRDGKIQFVGQPEINPRLDIVAERLISGVQTQVHVRGTARRPQLTLSSRPPLDEADILSLIIFGQPANALGEGEQVSLAQRAGALASGFVASSLAKSIGNALELDVFEIQTTPDEGVSGSGGSVTLGEQVGERLFFKFRQGFGSQTVSQFILEYQLSDFLRLQTSIAEGGGTTQRSPMQRVEQGGIDLIFYYSY